eukprot:CAMPEP_0176479260 /NCGR_PEP_ID=MMETSP0200_2-20121128/1644_1 /TAXON_ID=947934 /ORGANISM="Chaetoceros sp., Strain GSL56" /LENGTH=511 /DNA_ID=CAMNT_0017875291 /DNA_START=2164 /DNA_END=3699 /DNA_ORIENTATION=+
MTHNTKKREWRSAVDPKTGRTYYYDVLTRETQWKKPLELATPKERNRIEETQRKQKEFFRSMEANILTAMNRGHVPGMENPADEDVVKPLPTDMMIQHQSNNTTRKKKLVLSSNKKPTLIRTISSMDDELIAELTQNSVDKAISSPGMISPDSTTTAFFDEYSCATTTRTLQKSFSHLNLHNDLLDDSTPVRYDPETNFDRFHYVNRTPQLSSKNTKVSKHLEKPVMMKRNTCGSLYISDTMADPDKDACIKCLCGVFRTHIVQSTKYTRQSQHQFHEYEIFNDDFNDRQTTRSSHAYIVQVGDSIEMMRIDGQNQIPSHEDITYFYRYVFNKAQMENDCMIMSLIYVERLLRETNGGVCPNVKNWRSILFSCMVLASKVWDDLSMWNADFSQACPQGVNFSLQRINELELALLTCLNYNVRVSASEYAKYYFLMRSMMIRSGLTDKETLCNTPLDIHAAKKLEYLASSNSSEFKPCVFKRSKSMDGIEVMKDPKSSSKTHLATLEQVIRM